MKFAAIALASALAAAGVALPSFAQQNQSDQSNQNQYGQAAQNQFQNGRDGGWRQRQGWREDEDFGGGGGWRRMHGMQGMMDRMERHHRFASESEGAHFRLRRGQAVIDVKCPENESMQACVSAAGQLLDKVAGMRNGNTTTGMTNGAGRSTGDLTGSQQSAPSLNPGGSTPGGSSIGPGSSTPSGTSNKLPGQD
jgi:hypothetical protein